MYQALEVASSETAAPAVASAFYNYYFGIEGCFAPLYRHSKYMKQKQQQEQQLQSLLPPELDTLTLHEGGLPNIKGGLHLFRPLEYMGNAAGELPPGLKLNGGFTKMASNGPMLGGKAS